MLTGFVPGSVNALPGARPSSVDYVDVVSPRTGYEKAASDVQGQNAVVFQQYDGLIGCCASGRLKAFAVEFRVVLDGWRKRIVKQAELELQTQNAAHRFIKSGFADAAFFNQLQQQVAEYKVVGHHAHVDARFNGHAHGIFHGGCDLVDVVQLHNVFPVGHGEALKLEFVAEQVGQDAFIGMHGNAVEFAAVDHHSGGSGFDGGLEAWQEVLAKLTFVDVHRRAVFSGARGTVTQEVLHAGCYTAGVAE